MKLQPHIMPMKVLLCQVNKMPLIILAFHHYLLLALHISTHGAKTHHSEAKTDIIGQTPLDLVGVVISYVLATQSTRTTQTVAPFLFPTAA